MKTLFYPNFPLKQVKRKEITTPTQIRTTIAMFDAVGTA
jgi:hypothetical protein